jgi:hypothetical protein
VVSQFLTLYITPVIYIYLDSFQKKVRRTFGTPHPELAEALPAEPTHLGSST